VAHVAAWRRHLPPDFDHWEWATNLGWIVAHVAAVKGHLPPDFDRWELADQYVWSVAHEAAKHGHLPPDVPAWVWDLADADGDTVADVAEMYAPPKADADADDKTVEYVAVSYFL